MKEYGTSELTTLINSLVASYSLPKKISADYENVFVETRLIEDFRCFLHMQGRALVSLNQVIPYLSKLAVHDKEKLVSTRGLPDVLYRMFVAEKSYMIGFQALILPTNDGHSVKRVNYATEVTHDQANRIQENHPETALA